MAVICRCFLINGTGKTGVKQSNSASGAARPTITDGPPTSYSRASKSCRIPALVRSSSSHWPTHHLKRRSCLPAPFFVAHSAASTSSRGELAAACSDQCSNSVHHRHTMYCLILDCLIFASQDISSLAFIATCITANSYAPPQLNFKQPNRLHAW